MKLLITSLLLVSFNVMAEAKPEATPAVTPAAICEKLLESDLKSMCTLERMELRLSKTSEDEFAEEYAREDLNRCSQIFVDECVKALSK